MALKSAVRELPAQERSVGRAYALGYVCHYLLDSTVHPLVISQVNALCGAGVEGLTTEDAHEVHAVIETELDELVLTAKRGETVATYHPATSVLRGRDSMLDTVGRLYAGAVDDAFGLAMPKGMFKSAVRAERAAQRALYSPTGAKRAVLSAAERLVRPHAMTGAMSHRAAERATSAFANDERAPWRHPATEAVSRASFWDLYDQARAGALDAIKAMDADDFDLAASHRLTADVNFYGEPVVALGRGRGRRRDRRRRPRRAESVGTPMTLETAFDLPFWFEFAATVTGGLSGGMSAVRARYDIFGTVAIACITGMGGGIIRDILLQNYGLYAFQSPWFLLSCALAGVAVFYFGKLATYLDPIVDLLDNISVALWAIIGASKSLSAGLTVIPSVVLGTITSTAGASPRRAHEPPPVAFQTGPIYGARPHRLHGLLPAEATAPARHGGSCAPASQVLATDLTWLRTSARDYSDTV